MSAAQAHGGRSIRLPALILLEDPTRADATPVFTQAFGIEQKGFRARYLLTSPRTQEDPQAPLYAPARFIIAWNHALAVQADGGSERPLPPRFLNGFHAATAPKMAKRNARHLFWWLKF